MNTRFIYPIRDFLRSYKQHAARMKQTGMPEVLTINGRAELVVMDTDTYEGLRAAAADPQIDALRAHLEQARAQMPLVSPAAPEEIARREAILDEMTADTENMGRYEAEQTPPGHS